MSAETSPLPWRYDERCIRPFNDGRVVARLDWHTRDFIDDNNGDLIVKAVNAHDELVEALNGLLRNCLTADDYQPRRTYNLSMTGAAISTALRALAKVESSP